MKKLFSIISIIMLLFSCEKNTIFEKKEPISTKSLIKEKTCEIINNTIHFTSPEALSKLSDSLKGLSQEALYAWEKENNFYSLYHAIEDAEENISNGSEVEKYANLVYLSEDSCIMPLVIPTFYQLICNPEGYFYIGKYKHQVTDKEIIIENVTRSGSQEKYGYIATNPITTLASEDQSLSLGNNSYKANKRSVRIDAYYCRKIAKDNATGKTLGQQYIHVKSTAGKKVLGKYKKYKTVHVFDGLAYMVENAGIKLPNGSYTNKTVRYENGGGAGSVGESKTWSMDYTVSTYNVWIPIEYLSMHVNDVIFFEERARTRGTGDSGAVLYYQTKKAGIWPSLPYIIPATGTIITTRPIINENI